MSMNVSINPSYFCNFNCSFCYLTKEQLADTKKIPLAKLDKLLGQIPDISYVDLYGGEIGALKKDYFYGLKDVIRNHYKGEINIITNYSMLHEGFFADDVYLSVSYDFSAREKQQLVFQNMLMSPVPIAVLILASEEVLNMSEFYDKGYAFFRSCMDNGINHELLIELIKFLMRYDLYDARDLDDDHWQEFGNLFGEDDDFEYLKEMLIDGEFFGIPDLMDRLQSYSNIVITGGGVDECLKEVELALEALGKPYEIEHKFTY